MTHTTYDELFRLARDSETARWAAEQRFEALTKEYADLKIQLDEQVALVRAFMESQERLAAQIVVMQKERDMSRNEAAENDKSYCVVRDALNVTRDKLAISEKECMELREERNEARQRAEERRSVLVERTKCLTATITTLKNIFSTSSRGDWSFSARTSEISRLVIDVLGEIGVLNEIKTTRTIDNILLKKDSK